MGIELGSQGKHKSAVTQLFASVVEAGRCSGCAACVLSCPVDALGYDDEHPLLLDGCIDCVLCSRACARFAANDDEIESYLQGAADGQHTREAFGRYRSIAVARSTAGSVREVAQDGGVVSALLLYAFEAGSIDGAVVSGKDGTSPWVPVPRIVVDGAGVVSSAGSRYTYSPNLLALHETRRQPAIRLALIGTPCHVTGLRYLQTAKSKQVRQTAGPVTLSIGLLCSETFSFQGLMVEGIEKGLGVDLRDVVKINIKGRVLVYLANGEVKTIPLRQVRQYARAACGHCRDFSAEHADISVGGLGSDGWTVAILRTEVGERLFEQALAAGTLETRPAEEFGPALELLVKLAAKQKERPLAKGQIG